MGRAQRRSGAALDTSLGATDSGKIIRDLLLIYLIKTEIYQNQVDLSLERKGSLTLYTLSLNLITLTEYRRKNHMLLSVDRDNALHKIQYVCMIKK